MTDYNYFKPLKALTFATVAADRVRLIALLNESPSTAIHCDLSAVETCDSAGLALLIDMRRLCGQYGRTLRIEHIPEGVRALATLYGVELILYES
jgi:phospholipid transport system transporter-binding protein